MAHTNTQAIGEQILQHIFHHRRLISHTEPCGQKPCPLCLAPHMQKIQYFIEREKPIHFILPAFPAKSPNQKKVLSSLPDMGERVALQFLQSLCVQIRDIYAPGAEITICSDGRVFSDLVCVSDENVTTYGREIRNIINEINADAIALFNLEDVLMNLNFDQMREKIVLEYGESLENLRLLVKTDLNYRNLFNGIHRFLCEDYQALQPFKTRNQIKTECKELAYSVIQRSNAWSSLVAKQFPQALRFSIHPQPFHSEKIGIHMIKTLDQWGTPWHNAVVHDGNQFLLLKRSQAEKADASLIWHKDRPSHFQVADISQFITTISTQEAA
ncbi:isocyanide synthase family protein [Nostoc sp. ChiSLP03a]|uniref:isocyanide synthase family protein n=1 Tax=Nostoc sp. ChiSLP03a TaxID=3075380 RepID=UPI002AD20E08|nr:isocyanide synthase family protein [Nostoc sp. ChiSLP03a]MDZ8216452.1 isocyanide synthase family protein [Nostoc sp. ChiSLP03a]